jgi:hypothetical protein
MGIGSPAEYGGSRRMKNTRLLATQPGYFALDIRSFEIFCLRR